MVDQHYIKQHLEEIFNSAEFKKSPRYQELLRFLVNESIAGRSPKEFTIATEVFGKDASFSSKDDPIVRVYVNNLRKKLEHFYLTSNKSYPYHISIPTGHYAVEFVATPPEQQKTRILLLQKKFISVLSTIGIFALGFFFAHFFVSRTSTSKFPLHVWNNYIHSTDRQTLIVVGDYFFLRSIKNPEIYYRDIAINSLDDYRALIRRDPSFAQQYAPSDFTFLRTSAIWGIVPIEELFHNLGKPYSIKLASQFTVDDFKKNNVVFLGSFKTLYKLSQFFPTLGVQYTIVPPSIRVYDARKDTTYTFVPDNLQGGNYERDYAVIIKSMGPDGSNLLFLLGFSESGIILAAQMVCNPNFDEIVKKLSPSTSLHDYTHFIMVVHVEGINQAIFDSKVSFFAPLHSEAPESK